MDTAIINLTSPRAQTLTFTAAAYSAIVKATCNLSIGRSATLSDKQILIANGDTYVGDSEEPTVHYESDFVPFKPRAEFLCVGKAYALAGRPVQECLVTFSVGKPSKSIRVVGNRVWRSGFRNWFVAPSEPEPFTSMPVSYENAYGGADLHLTKEPQTFPANPIGKGYCKSGKGMDGLPLPNLEDPAHPIKSWKDQPRPMAFGPIGRTWQPRLRKAGTYDEQMDEGASARPAAGF